MNCARSAPKIFQHGGESTLDGGGTNWLRWGGNRFRWGGDLGDGGDSPPIPPSNKTLYIEFVFHTIYSIYMTRWVRELGFPNLVKG